MAVKSLQQRWSQAVPYGPYAFFVAVAVMLLWPLLSPGFILTLDMIFTPNIPLPDHVTSSYLFYFTLHVLNGFLPADLLQKIILLLLLCGSGIGMYRLVRYFTEQPNMTAAIIAGLVYMVNPFVYSRLMAGQFAVLLGYACLPFFIKSFLRLIEEPTTRNAIYAAAWLTVIGILSIHTLALCAVVMVVGLIVARIYRKKMAATVLASATAGVMFFVASFYWLLPLVAGESSTAQAIQGFGGTDQAAFAAVGGSVWEQLVNIAGLQGFWADATELYVLPQQVLPSWPLITLGVWVLVVYGYVRLRRQLDQTMNLHIIVFAALVAGVLATTLFSSLFTALPLAMGMREPHKFVGLVAVVFSVCIGWSLAAIIAYIGRLYKNRYVTAAITACALLVPFAWTPTMLGGMHGQLQPRTYPAEWFAANDFLNADRSNFKALFLPWHGYQRFDFSGRIIMNPADRFFDKPMLVSNELEFRGAAPTFPDQTKTYITKTLLPQAPIRNDLAERLNNITIKYVVIAQEDTGSEYVAHQPDIQLVFNTAKIKIYQNMQYTERRI